MNSVKTICVAVAALAAGLILALGVVTFADHHVPFGAIVAFVMGLAVAASLLILGISRSRKSPPASRSQAYRPGGTD